MEIVVAETDPALMRAAVKTAAVLAGEMDGEITILSVANVSWPAPLVSSRGAEERFARRVRAYAASTGQDLNGHLVFARGSETAYRDCVTPGAFVVVPTHPRRWWRTREERLARDLKRLRFRVILLKIG